MWGEDPIVIKLMRALDQQDKATITQLLQAEPHLSTFIMPSHSSHGRIPILNRLIEMQDLELIKIALNNLTSEELRNLLHDPSGKLRVSPDINTPLMRAIELGDMEIIQTIIEKDPTALNKRQLSGTQVGLTPLILATTLENQNLVTFLVESGADVNTPSLIGMTALSVAKRGENQSIAEFLISQGAIPSIHQGHLLDQFASWLELKALSVENVFNNDVQYDKELIEKLAKDLRLNGHCSGFSWMHRLMTDKKQADLFTAYMQKIAEWDQTAASLAHDPFLDKVFNELLQITIYAQQSESLDLITEDDSLLIMKNPTTTNQNSAEIARMISPDHSDRFFSDYVQLDVDDSFRIQSADEIKDYIDHCYDINASTYTNGNDHAIDIGKDFHNGQEVYWIYNPNFDCGTIYFTSFDEFYSSLMCSLMTSKTMSKLTTVIADNAMPIRISSYMKPLEYRYEVSQENIKPPEQSIESFLLQKMPNDFYVFIELNDEALDGIYIEFKNDSFYFNKKEYKTLPELRQAMIEFCGENLNDKIVGVYNIQRLPPILSEDVMIKMLTGAIHVNDSDLALRLKTLISDEANIDKLLEKLVVTAATEGDIQSLKCLLTLKPELALLSNTSAMPKGEALISLAVQSKNISCVEEILNHAPDLISFVSTDGYYKGHNLLTMAIKQLTASTDMIEYLINKHPDLTNHSITMGMDTGFGPLHIAIKERTERVKTLLECAPHTVNEVIQVGYRKNNSALMYAVQAEKEEVIKLLLQYGADPYYTNNGKSAIDIAKLKPARIQQLLGTRPSGMLFQGVENASATSMATSSVAPVIRTEPVLSASSSTPSSPTPPKKLKGN